PPEGGGGTSPQPPKTGKATRANRYAESAALEPGDYTPAAAETQRADDFLQDLPGKWQMGPSQARACAPLAASRAHTQGYDLEDEADRLLLELTLTQDNPNDPVRRPSSVMPARLRDLKRKRAGETPGTTPRGQSGGLAAWCGKCNRGEKPMAAFQRIVEMDDGSDAPCPACHPKHARA
ncbi:hypothetical protein, partial [Streptomyces sp. 8L]|uniref:hypothetical protein n=1 Tax=Streptomyces sp. 8L TaxID=2877242 RepID=UPI001CD6CA33